VTVTESKMLRDAVLGEREVDIVIEGEFDGEPMVISVEVIEHGRVATLPWVEQMLRKHRDLPTNRLLLVSKSGFSHKALTVIEREAGRVQALTPRVIEVNGEVVVKRLFVDAIDYKPTDGKVHVRNGDDRIVVVGYLGWMSMRRTGPSSGLCCIWYRTRWDSTQYGCDFPSKRTSTPKKARSRHFPSAW
jgi:hypothetical protein